MSTAQSGGGAATHSGTEYQNRVAAWSATRILAESAATPGVNLNASAILQFLLCETTEPVDDLLIGISTSGHLFAQAKHTIDLGTTAGSEFAGVIDQFVRQFHAHPTPNSQSAWDRPLDKSLDRLVLVTSSRSSKPIREVLPSLLKKIRALAPSQQLDSIASSDDERAALATLKDHINRSWKSVRSSDPTEQQICQVASLIWVQTLNVDADEAQEREAKDLLRLAVLKNPNDGDLAWAKLVSACATFAANRTGATRSELERILTAAGIEILPVSSYRGDIQKLKALSANGMEALRLLSEIPMSGGKSVKLSRAATIELKSAAKTGSLVVVGQPGAGKSGALHDVAVMLQTEGDVLLFVVDQINAGSLGFLRNELACSHEIVEILRNWPGTKPGFLLVDALDAVRIDQGVTTFRDLIRSVHRDKGRWHVIPSIRKFDLRHSPDLKALFVGGPVSNYQDAEFQGVRHLEIPLLSDEEIREVSKQSSELQQLIAGADPRLRDLLRIPFNLRLMAGLVGAGVAVNSLTPIRTQIELLERYWLERVIGSDTQGDARESILRKATLEMVRTHSFKINRSTVAGDPGISSLLHQILSAQILVEWQHSPGGNPDGSVLTYAHHILFDYAVSRLVFRGLPERTVEWIENEHHLLVEVRPSLALHFQYLWHLDPNRQAFWDCVFAFFNSSKIPLTGKILGPQTAAQLLGAASDCQPLLDAMRDERNPNHASARTAFQHLVGAGHPSSGMRPLVGTSAASWADILKEAAGI